MLRARIMKRLISPASQRNGLPRRLPRVSLRPQLYSPTSCSLPPAWLFRQFDSVRVFVISFVLFGKNLFEPLCLLFCNPPIHRSRDCGPGRTPRRNRHTGGSPSLGSPLSSVATLLYRDRPHHAPSPAWLLNQTGSTLRSFGFASIVFRIYRQPVQRFLASIETQQFSPGETFELVVKRGREIIGSW